MSAVLQEGPKPGEQGGIEVTRVLPGQESLLTPAALAFLAGFIVGGFMGVAVVAVCAAGGEG